VRLRKPRANESYLAGYVERLIAEECKKRKVSLTELRTGHFADSVCEIKERA
jgi:hypothetical protein